MSPPDAMSTRPNAAATPARTTQQLLGMGLFVLAVAAVAGMPAVLWFLSRPTAAPLPWSVMAACSLVAIVLLAVAMRWAGGLSRRLADGLAAVPGGVWAPLVVGLLARWLVLFGLRPTAASDGATYLKLAAQLAADGSYGTPGLAGLLATRAAAAAGALDGGRAAAALDDGAVQWPGLCGHLAGGAAAAARTGPGHDVGLGQLGLGALAQPGAVFGPARERAGDWRAAALDGGGPAARAVGRLALGGAGWAADGHGGAGAAIPAAVAGVWLGGRLAAGSAAAALAGSGRALVPGHGGDHRALDAAQPDGVRPAADGVVQRGRCALPRQQRVGHRRLHREGPRRPGYLARTGAQRRRQAPGHGLDTGQPGGVCPVVGGQIDALHGG